MNSNLKLRLVALATALTLTGGLVACGDDDEDSADSAATTEATETEDTSSVTLVADDAGGNYTFELSATPTAETEEIVFDNQGEQPHVLIFARLGEGFTVDEAFELEGRKGSAETLVEADAGPGKSKTVPIDGTLEPGNYAMLCPIPGPGGKAHYELGQLEEFTLES
ncbi:MAG TPA: hypothetical protein VHF58_08585 [Solirubrobacterales bacterium]|nr:hypothetical protein [Solirubrobacterales bacterium]